MMHGKKTDLMNIELVKQLVVLRDHVDIHRIIGLNVDGIHDVRLSTAFVGYLQASAHSGLAMHFCKIYESSGRNDLNSIPGIIESLPRRKPSKKQQDALSKFGIKYSNAASPEEIKSFLLATFGLFSGLHSESLSRLKRYRDTIGAHSDHKAERNPLPSHSEFELLYDFALDFYNIISEAIVNVGPASVSRKTGLGLVRTLKSLGVKDPQFDFPPDQ